MIRCLCAILAGLALALTAPAQAQLRDVLIVERDGAAYLWLAFSAQPAAAALEAGALHVAGVEGETRAIRPAGPAPFSALTLSARADGVRLELHGAAWTDAELREGGVWARLDAAQGHGAHAPLHSSQTPDLAPGAEASADSASPGLTRPDASADAPDPATHGAIPPDDAVPPGGAIPPAPGAERPAAAQ
ncbi:MAG: hypothetical protein JJU18_11260, partial [Oceanicaulis sp.]|nr:hypothetical protein [Oceanicaulis sp.]